MSVRFSIPIFLGPPKAPQILNSEADFSATNVTVRWSRPPLVNGCSITMYTLRYRVTDPISEGNIWTVVNVSYSNGTSYNCQLNLSKSYEFVVSAWNELGQGDASEAWHFKTALGNTFL